MFSPMKRLRNHEAVGVDLVQAEELLGEIADRVADVDPRLVAFVEVDVAEAVRLHHVSCLFSRSPRWASMTTVRLWQAWMSAGS